MPDTIIQKALNDELLTTGEIAKLFELPLFSEASAKVIAASRLKSEKACQGLAEVHGQVGLNIAPCPKNCAFCAFAAQNNIFKESIEFSVEEVVKSAKQFEAEGANGVFIMATADYAMAQYIEVSQEIRNALKPETVMVANVGDFSLEEGKQLKEAGYAGIYHAIRLGEGRDNNLSVKQRYQTFENAREAGLILGTCLEPVGNEHTIEELVEKTLVTRDANPCFSGSARRIPIPGTELFKHGIVSEARMAHIIAVVRLVVASDVPGNCTHEPNVIGAAAGANLLWAESGSNPRDTEAKTEEKRGMTVSDCRTVLEEAEWKILEGPSKFYSESYYN